MQIQMKLYILLTAILVNVAHANSTTEHKHKNHGQDVNGIHSAHTAHVHGIAQLTIAQDGAQVELMLLAPAMDIVGFEKPAESLQQKKALEHAKKIFSHPEQWLQIRGGDCQLRSAHTNLQYLWGENTVSGNAEKHHSDVEVAYSYNCAAAEKIKAIEVTLFDAFPAVVKVNIQWIMHGQQSAMRLSPQQRRVEF